MPSIWENLAGVELRDAQPVVYDRPVGLRQLHRDNATGAEHYLIRYPAGLTARRHRHSAAHTLVVLEGRLAADGQVAGPGAYVHFPGGVPHHHAPADGGSCLFVALFDGPFDAEPLDGDHGGP
jgi:quercetin dioxygenase-like cupin family protein